MQNSITTQIKKLDKDLNLCKNRLSVLYRRKIVDSTTQTSLKKKKQILKTSNMDKNKKKKGHAECIPDKIPKKVTKVNKNNANPKKKEDEKLQNKPRSRSVSSCRDVGGSQENEYNNLVDHERVLLVPKNSWGNILKEQNTCDYYKCRTPLSHRQEALAKNICRIEDKLLRDKYLSNEPQKPFSIFLKNKGVQCTDPPLSGTRHSSSSTGTYFAYNPTRALQFLISEFRDYLKYQGDDKMLNMVNDMEDVISRMKPTNDLPKTIEPKCSENLNFKVANVDSQTKLAESYNKLETTCQTLEAACSRLKDEKHLLERELDSKRMQLKSFEIKLCDYENKISKLNSHIFTLNQKNDLQSQTIKELNNRIDFLQQDKKSLECLKEVQLKLEDKLKELNEENENLLKTNQLLLLDKKKNTLLLEIKDQQLLRLKSDIECLGGDINERLVSVHVKMASDESIESDAPLCSSPNSSLCTSPVAYPSWRRVSSISSHRGASPPPPRSSSSDNNNNNDGCGSDPPRGIQLLKKELKAMFTELRVQTTKPTMTTVSSTDNESSKMWKDFQALPSNTGFHTLD